jgi:hypothetical protein
VTFLRTLLFASAHYAGMLAFAAVAYLLALPLTKELRFDSRAERIALRGALGLGLLSYLVMALALAGQLEPLVLIGAVALLVLAVFLRERETAISTGERTHVSPRIGAILAGIILLAGSWPALYPTTRYDAVNYHLPAAKLHIEENGLAFSPHIRLNFAPQLWELLYTAAFLVGDEVVANLLHYLALCLVVLLLFAAGRRFFGPWTGAWAAALFLANPIVLAIAPAANIDLAPTLFCLAGLAAAGVWVRTQETPWLATGALLLGFAASTKYTGLVFLGLAAIAILLRSLSLRTARPVVIFVLLSALPFLPWLLRTLLTTSTPFGFYFGSLFGPGRLDPQDLQDIVMDMRLYGYPKTLRNLLAAPWNVVFHPERFVDPPAFSKLLMLGLPAALAGAVRDRVARTVMALVVACGAFWFFTYQNTRLLLPILPFYCLAVAAGAESLFRAAASRLKPGLRSAALILLTSAAFLPAARLVARDLRGRDRVPTTGATRDEYLTRFRRGYRAVQSLNGRRGSDYALYSLFAPELRHDAAGRFFGDWFGPAAYRKALARLHSPAGLHAHISGFGATHFLIGKQTLRAFRVSYPGWPDSFYEMFRPLYSEPGFELYELSRPGHPFRVGIDEVHLGDPAAGSVAASDWEKIGRPQTLAEKSSGVTIRFVRSNRFSFYAARTAASPTEAYVFSARVRSRSFLRWIDLRIEWLDETGRSIRTDRDSVKPRTDWVLETTTAIAPDGARQMRLLVASPSAGWVDWRDLSIKRLRYGETAASR